MPRVQIKRGTRAQLETAANNSQLAAGELYLIEESDYSKTLVAGTSTYEHVDVTAKATAEANRAIALSIAL
jgi:hypothetical protein